MFNLTALLKSYVPFLSQIFKKLGSGLELDIFQACSTFNFTIFCGISGNYMKLNFKTDGSVTRRGFKVGVKSVCGGYLSQPQGIITSPNFPNDYGNNLDCFWAIRTRPGRTFSFWFDTMNVTSSNRHD